MKEKTIREERIKVEEWKTKHLKAKDGTKKDVVGQAFKECSGDQHLIFHA